MTDATAKLSPDVLALVEEQGLQRAASLFPETVAAAAAKGLTPLTASIPPLTVPVIAFRPATGDKTS